MNEALVIAVAAIVAIAAAILISTVIAGGRSEKRIQRMLPLLLVIIGSAPGIAHADSLWAIYGGRSYHLDPSISRSLLNQDQHTAGLAWQHGRWELQVSHMTDSFSCPSDEAAGLHRWPLFHHGVVRGGLEAGIFLAHRCINFREKVGVLYTRNASRPNLPPGVISWIRTCTGGGCQYDYWRRAAGAAREHWIIGAIPAAYLQVWRLRLELGVIVTGPMDGAGDAIAYGQLSIKLASW